MKHRSYQFFALLAVVGVSIVFGMVLGGRLNAPDYALAAGTWETALPASRPVPQAVVDFADVVERAMPAVVSVTSATRNDGEAENPHRRMQQDPFRWFFGPPGQQDEEDFNRRPTIGEGSGFIITADGYVLTNNHVVSDADRVTVGTQDGRTFEAKVIGTDPSIDLALLKLDTDGARLPTLPLGDSDALRVGEWVIAIGNPLDYQQTVTVGVVSAKDRRVPLRGTDTGVATFLQTDAAINLGNSGGPLLDAGGNVVGINTAITRANYAEGIGFALPIAQARRAVEQLRATGEVRRGFIGITMNPNPIDSETRDYYGLPDTFGVLVADVADDGPAEKAGVRAGDIIRKVDGETVRDNADLIAKISSQMPGDTVRLEVFRNGETERLEARLSDRNEGLAAQVGPGAPSQPDRGAPDARDSALGITVENLDDEARERLRLDPDVQGVLIADVDYDSQAADKGIDRLMIVVSVDDRPVRNVREWSEAIGGLRPGSTVKLEVLAGSQGRLVFLRVPDAE